MSTTMSAAERARLLQALKEDAEFRDEVRRQLLSDELLELPDKFAQFTAYVTEFIARTERFMTEQQAFNARTEQFMTEQQAFNARTERFMTEQQAFNARAERFMTEQQTFNAGAERFMTEQQAFNAGTERFMTEQQGFNARTENRLNRMEDNIGILKGNAARRLLRDHLELVLELTETDFVRTLSGNDLFRLVRNSGEANEIPYGERRSFYAADLVIEAIDPQGNACYITAEASYTADNRDSRRAIRNAEFMNRFTGHPAHPVVASVNNDYEVQDLVNRGTVQWFRLDERELESD